jgi:site-specific DNA-methyltransferase (adenine-specific)
VAHGYIEESGEMLIINGDCIEEMRKLDDNSVDSIVTDPPYELGFMGKSWDSTGIAYNINVWREALRVLKPGGHMLAFGGTRTYHRMACAIEDAGFEIRDQMQWLYGSGMPHGQDISKAIDKKLGKTREVIGSVKTRDLSRHNGEIKGDMLVGKSTGSAVVDITAPASDEAKQWLGWNTHLKPSCEPMVLARKPLSEKTVADNVMRWGTGGINIADSRIPLNGEKQPSGSAKRIFKSNAYTTEKIYGDNKVTPLQGRFPANVLFDESAAAILDKQSGGASRFFYCAKASKRERGDGNVHPTVKPLKLMEYLVTLVTPPNGVVLDPFAGSGTTGIAAKNKGFDFIGIERDAHYCEIARRRID